MMLYNKRMKKKIENQDAARPLRGAIAPSDIVLPIVPRQEPRSAGAGDAEQKTPPPS